MDIWEIDPLWGIVDSFSIFELSVLMLGVDPEKYADGLGSAEENWEIERKIKISRRAIVAAIEKKTLRAKLIFPATPRHYAGIDNYIDGLVFGKNLEVAEDDLGKEFVIEPVINWDEVKITKSDAVAWLKSISSLPAFFESSAQQSDSKATNSTGDVLPAYLDPKHPRYSYRLAAAVKAWETVTETNGKAVKKALEDWLKAHSEELGFVDQRTGRLSKNARESIAQITNWSIGGAPPTPGSD